MTKEERRANKTAYQREYRKRCRERGIDPYNRPRLPDDVKQVNKEIRKAKQRMWFASDEGKIFIAEQARRKRKYANEREREIATNINKKEKRKTDLRQNLMYRLAGCKKRAKYDNLPFDLDLDYLFSIYTDTCPYLGIKLQLVSTAGNSMDAMSIDKIDPKKGYVKGNVQFISYKANVMKQDVSIDMLLTFAKNVIERHG